VANTLALFRNGAVGFIDWLDAASNYGRSAGVGRGRGVGVHLPVHGVGVGVGLGVAVAVTVAVADAVAVGVGLGVGAPDCAQYLPPVFRLVTRFAPPQTIISLFVQTAV
jgi:hypothetical protein